MRRALYRRGWLPTVRLPVPVIVVGNIYVGGTGKTPLTIWLVQILISAGYRPGVISRGYASHQTTVRAVAVDASAQDVGDEPLLIARRAGCPVMVGRDRPAAAQALLRAHPQVNVIVADDGLQHYRLGRDIEIMLFDERGIGNGWLLPAGPLREMPARRRDFTVLNAPVPDAGAIDASVAHIGSTVFRMQLIGVIAEQLSDRSRRMPLTPLLHVPTAPAESDELADASHAASQRQASRVVAAAGIGNPARFFNMLRATGLLFDELPLPDHYPFSDNPFVAETADIILITEKDAVKCNANPALANDPRLWVVPVTARIDDALTKHLLEKLRGHPTA